MQFRDLQKQYEVLKPEMDAAMIAVASGAHFISGEQVKTLEERLAAYVGSTASPAATAPTRWSCA